MYNAAPAKMTSTGATMPGAEAMMALAVLKLLSTDSDLDDVTTRVDKGCNKTAMCDRSISDEVS